ncbi:hypothetical protein DV737_g1975, partial [Chaetothyriales sp. CBS 132003]
MILWASPSLLVSNPGFEQLHKRLVTDILDHDLADRLTAHRVSRARELLLAAVLFDLALGDDNGHDEEPLSKDVREASLMIATYLYGHHHGHVSHDSALLFPLLLSDISTLGSNNLVSRQFNRVRDLQTQQIPQARYGVTNSAVGLLRAQAQEAEWLVRWLEQRRHGAQGRYVGGRARWLAGVARGMAAKAKVGYLEGWRDGDGEGDEGWQQKVRQKMGQLQEEEEELVLRESELSEALAEYAGDEEMMQQLGKRYAEIESEIDQVKADVERLSSRSPQWVPP